MNKYEVLLKRKKDLKELVQLNFYIYVRNIRHWIQFWIWNCFIATTSSYF